ncbi:cupin domain-containing protein [Jatrophihabitans sp.]|uniref:cupin domain-containing protein n=1 Tax=Jatrophihabitans sp. TaxID=1932789 RepID=UPI0030C6C0E1|nr:Cupin 2 conserved barrel domain protein [Jatrophihabitans sp.]
MKIAHGGAEGQPTAARSDRFSGTAFVDPLVTGIAEGHGISAVTFPPGTRTHWHSHEHGQILVVTSGRGLICVEGEDPQPLRAGDVVWCAPGELHWHGGTASTLMTHVATSLGSPAWSGPVSDADYRSASGPA